jgi:hypothetical protein
VTRQLSLLTYIARLASKPRTCEQVHHSINKVIQTMSRYTVVMLAFLALSWGMASAQQFSTCNSPNVSLAIVETDKLAGNCTNATTTATTYHTYSCLTATTAVVSNCRLTIKSSIMMSPTDFPCYAIDFAGNLTGKLCI